MSNAARAVSRSPLAVAATAVIGILVAQAFLTSTIHGSNYYGVDGKMAQATVLFIFKFGQPFEITALSAIQGVGSQLLTKNAWANPAFWPFGLVDRVAATDLSALIALASFSIACYIMARCFDVALVPRALAAQLCIVLFAPLLLIVHTPTNFCLTPADAVVYAPYMVAIGLLARLNAATRTAIFWAISAGITALIAYSVYCDPLFTMIGAVSWAVPFFVVTVAVKDRRTFFMRAAALGVCLAVLLASGAAEYLYTLSQYTARVQFPAVLDRPRGLGHVSAMSYSSNMKYFYFFYATAALLGLALLRGRARLLIIASLVTFVLWLAYSLTYLMLLNAVWVPPIPIYLEQCLFPLHMAAAVAGVCAAAAALVRFGARILNRQLGKVSEEPGRFGVISVPLAAALFVCVIPGWVIKYSLTEAKPMAEIFNLPWPDAPELIGFFEQHLGRSKGAPFRGSINFVAVDSDTGDVMTDLWSRGIPTINEYSQLVTPQALYFVHKLLERDVRGHLNRFDMHWMHGHYSMAYWNALQMMGARYIAGREPLAKEFDPGLVLAATLPYRPSPLGGKPGNWYVYELPRPNVGTYSPTDILTARDAASAMAILGQPAFDFTERAVLFESIDATLVPARSLQFSLSAGRLHVKGHSDGTSLVVLPQQFTHCLRPRNEAVQLVRANLMMTAMVFKGDVDTEIAFDYGILTPRCRRADLDDVRKLGLKIDLRMQHLVGNRVFPEWNGAVSRLRAALSEIQ